MKPYRFSQGGHEVVLTAHGTGQSFSKGLALNRWNGDPLGEGQGYFFYLRDAESGQAWSATPKPCLRDGVAFQAWVSGRGLAWEARHQGIVSRLEVSCAACAEGEVRGLELRNGSDRRRVIEVTSFLEVVLHYRDADAGHPAFQKLFVQTEWDQASAALLARRRARGNDENWPWMVHRLAGAQVREYETDRLRFLGRGRNAARPLALEPGSSLSNTVGNVLDACFSLRAFVELEPGESRRVTAFLGAAASREEALGLRGDADPAAEAWSPLSFSPVVSSWPSAASTAEASAGTGETLRQDNGYGGFAGKGSEYVIRLPWTGAEPRWTPLPWVNCIANPQCGLLVSESGAACTWARNGQANRLTPWNNDPVSDPHGEALYVRDAESGEFWSPLPGPAPAPVAHEVRHGWGYSVFASEGRGLSHEVTFFVPERDPLRVVRWRVKNAGSAPRRLAFYSYCRLVLGTQVPEPGNLATAAEPERALLTAEYPSWSDFRGRQVFATSSLDGALPASWDFTCDRAGFLGAEGGGVRQPAALRSGLPLDGACGGGLDACFAQQVSVVIPGGATVEVAFLLGECEPQGESSMEALLLRYRRPGAVEEALRQAREAWRHRLQGIEVETPVESLNLMLNGWAAYQAMACRMVARNAFYQSSGAFGFRDQLQDAHGIAFLQPALAREQILRHAARQFAEGDVLHWWHPEPIDRGLRTRFSDDLLWLAFVTTAYAAQTGDLTIWDERVPFLRAALLAEGEDESYLAAADSGEAGPVYEHCCRAIDRSLATGSHGLPLMGTGDWNDGMNRIGRLGRGESVWMAFFLCEVLRGFAPVCQARGDAERAQRYLEHERRLGQAVEANAWDGAWYRRAYYDDGTPLGTASATECRIDGLVQSWAVISGAARPERARMAMESAWEELIDSGHGVVRLLTPPFVHTKEDPGYIKGYVAGVRENGGQYTHAACWFAKALAMQGRREEAARVLEWLTPVWHARNQGEADLYKVEPYAIAADIYHGAPHTGRGGWTWYTGSAAWWYRVALETVLGFRVAGGSVVELQPRVPDSWEGFQLSYRHGARGTCYRIRVSNPSRQAAKVVRATLDGAELALQSGCVRFQLAEDGLTHEVAVALG